MHNPDSFQNKKIINNPDIKESVTIKEKLLQNAAFRRVYANFEMYQELLKEYKGQMGDDKEIDVRNIEWFMKIVYYFNNIFHDEGRIDEQFTSSMDKIFELCEDNKLTPKLLIDELEKFLDLEELLDKFDPKPEKIKKIKKTGGFQINEMMYLEIDVLNENKIVSLNIGINNIDNTKDMIQKIYEGLQKLKFELENGSLIDTKYVKANSWLLTPDFKDKLKFFFKQSLIDKIDEVDDDHPEVEAIQNFALFFNKKSLKKYLLTQKKPKIYGFTVSKEEFLSSLLL